MTSSLAPHRFRAPIAALAGLLAASCGHDATPTGSWIPRIGGLTGSIAVASGVQPAPATMSPPDELGAEPEGLYVSSKEMAAARTLPASGGSISVRQWLTESTPDELIVIFRSSPAGISERVVTPAGMSDVQAAAAVMRTHLGDILPAAARVAGVSPAIRAAKISLSGSITRETIADELRHDPWVSAVVPNRLVALDDARYVPAHLPEARAGTSAPDNPLYAWQAWHYGLVDMPRAWGLSTGSAAVLVAVVDDGIRFDHPSISGNLTSDGYDFVSNADVLPLCSGGTIGNGGDGNGYDPDPTIPSTYYLPQPNCFAADRYGGHGLHVAGTVGAVGNSGVGMTGVNWNVRIRPVRVLGVGGFGNTWDIAQGVLYAAGLPADDGAGGIVQVPTAARVINLSLGSNTDNPVMHSAIAAAAAAGALVVAAAGNTGTSAPHYPASYPEVLAVAAVRPDGSPASYSNFGAYVGIRAPGGDFNQGGGSGGVGSTLWDFTGNAPDYAWATGTSMAAPHVTGVAALLLARTPSLTAADLRERLTKWSVGGANQWGAGVLNAYNSLSQRFGPPRRLFVRLQLTSTGEPGDIVPAQYDGTFSFNQVRAGSYYAFGGADESGDGQIGVPGRWWGAVGGVARPLRMVLVDSQTTAVSLTVGPPTIAVPSHTVSTQDLLVLGGYLQAVLVDRNRLDVYRFTVGRRRAYTFETSGWVGACGFALEEATSIGVFDSAGRLLLQTGFIDGTHYNYCSRLAVTLDPGSYLVAVAGTFSNGRYRLEMR